MDKKPILSICIPIFNRKVYLEKMLSRFLEDRDLFLEDIQLYISDNYSTENIKGVAEFYKSQGLNLEYHRNEKNLGMDGNFINCFNHAKGIYTWLLGSDDIPTKGILLKIVTILKSNNYGLLHLSNRKKERMFQVVEYSDGDMLCEDLHVWITFISGNIVRTDKRFSVKLGKYDGTYISQVPLYLHSLFKSDKNAILYAQYIDTDNDSKNNGGYNLFQVFVNNLYIIYQEYVYKGFLSQRSYKKIKHDIFTNWLLGYVVDSLISGETKEQKSLDLSDAWRILFKYYGHCPYAYYYVIKESFKEKLIGAR